MRARQRRRETHRPGGVGQLDGDARVHGARIPAPLPALTNGPAPTAPAAEPRSRPGAGDGRATSAAGIAASTARAARCRFTTALLSREGWYLLDDTTSPLLIDGGRWYAERPAHDGAYQDGYLFAYGDDYAARAGRPAQPDRAGAAAAAQRVRQLVLALPGLQRARLPQAARPIPRQPGAARRARRRHRLQVRRATGTAGSGRRTTSRTRAASSTGRRSRGST